MEVWSWKKQFRLTPTFYLPFALEYTEYVPYENVVEEYTDEVIKKMAEEELQKYLNELEKKGVQIISNSVTISLDADGGHVKGTLILDGPIGKKCPSAVSIWHRRGIMNRWRIMRQDEYY